MKVEATPIKKPWWRDWRAWAGLVLVAVAVISFIVGTTAANELLAAAQRQRNALEEWAHEYPLAVSAAFFIAYVLFASLALPGAMVLTLLGGAVFGLWWGVLLVSFASAAGATCALLVSRYLLRDRIQARYGERLRTLNQELDSEGTFYLLALRLNPVIPFFLINLLFGLTRMPARRFWLVSQVGMLPATFIYVNAGAQLAEVQSLKDLIQWEVVASLAALSIFPIVARLVAGWLRRHNR